MTLDARSIRLLRRAAGLLAILWLLAPAASADCAADAAGEIYCGGGRCLADRSGTVWCARRYEGGAQRTRDGTVLCGKGRCQRDARGRIFCSSEPGGAATKDSQGRVRCYGRCEPASADDCEHTLAGSSG